MQSTDGSYSTDIEVRFADLDAYGHVNNAVFFTYLETARTKLFLEKFIDFSDRGIFFLVVKAECEYRKPIGLPDRVGITMEIDRVGRSSFDIAYTIHNGAGENYAEAKTVMVCFDSRKKKPVAVPEDFTAHLA